MLCRFTIGLATLSLVMTGCLGPGTVVRVVEGHETEGPFIDPEAYSAYLEGSYQEARDNPNAALAAYKQALAADPSSAELWTRVGSIQCRSGALDIREAFRPARSLSPEYAPLWVEMARCLVAKEKIDSALPIALRAVELSPQDPEATTLVIRIYELLGRRADAERWRGAWRLFEPPRAPEPREAPASGIEKAQLLAEVDAALDAGALEKSRTLAVHARLSAGELAARAASRGKAQLALEQSTLVLRADPNDADAWIGAVVAADLLANDALLRHWLTRAPTDSPPPSALSASLFADLLERRIGPAAAAAWKANSEAP